MKADFEARNVKVVGLSIDALDDHLGWAGDIEDVTGHALNFPLVSDPDRKVALAYDMIHPEADATATVRSVFIIAPDKTVALTLTYPASTGRNFAEILRVVDSLQRTRVNKVATPANWQPGDDVIIVPSLNDEDARKVFPEFKNRETLPTNRPRSGALDPHRRGPRPSYGAAAFRLRMAT